MQVRYSAPCIMKGDRMKSVFVGNLNFQTTEADLTALFQPFGLVGRIHTVTDRETGRARGFAFVEMPNDTEAAKAIAALDGKEMGGRNLKVNEARPKGERPRVAIAAADAPAVVAVVADSRMRTTGSLPASPANRDGKLLTSMKSE